MLFNKEREATSSSIICSGIFYCMQKFPDHIYSFLESNLKASAIKSSYKRSLMLDGCYILRLTGSLSTAEQLTYVPCRGT